MIGEHGDYPINEYGQKLYPRKQFFDEIVAVFRETGCSVPIFNDKHLSWSFGESKTMMETAAELGFPLAGGSSLLHCPIVPADLLSTDDEALEAFALFSGCPDHYGFHIIELALSQIDRRLGGTCGICEVQALDQNESISSIRSQRIPPDLILSALQQHGYPADSSVIERLLERATDLFTFQFRFEDGFILSCLHLPTFVTGWTVAVRHHSGALHACSVEGGGASDFFSNFACLNSRIEEFFRTGVAPNPLRRTHLAAGALEAALQARKRPNRWIKTPHLIPLS